MKLGAKNTLTMKKIYTYAAIVALCATAVSSCQKEASIVAPETADKAQTTITFGISHELEQTKGTFDENGIKWAAGDVIRFSNEGLGDVRDITLKSSDISEDGYTATVTTDFPNVTTAVFRVNYSPRNNAEWDYGYIGNFCGDGSSFAERNKLTVKQSEAGHINKHFLLLHSGLNKLSFNVEEPQTTVSMEILGTIVRVLPYTTTYNEEEIQSVEISTTSDFGLGGVVKVDYATGQYTDHQDINWGPDRFKSYQVDLGTAFSLKGVSSRAASKAVYFALPATKEGHEINGYTIKVTTNKATYTFDDSSKKLALSHNTVKNIYLDLDKATSRVSSEDMYGIYWFDGNIGNQTYPASETTVEDLGYWTEYYQNTLLGETDVKHAGPAVNPVFFNSLTISAVDDATGAEPTWLTYGYRSATDDHWKLHLDANTSANNRSATITIKPAATVPHYQLREGTADKVITITQLGAATIVPSISNVSSKTIEAAGGTITATLNLSINGENATDEQFNTYISQVTLNASRGNLTRDGRTLTLTIGENPTTSARNITITAQTSDGNASVELSQKASATEKVYNFTYELTSGWNTTSCYPRELNLPATASSGRGDWVIIVTELKENGTPYVAGGAFDQDAVKPLIMKVMGLSNEQYTQMSEWLTLDIQVVGAQWIIVVRGLEKNETGAQRILSGSFFNADGSLYGGTYSIKQDA